MQKLRLREKAKFRELATTLFVFVLTPRIARAMSSTCSSDGAINEALQRVLFDKVRLFVNDLVTEPGARKTAVDSLMELFDTQKGRFHFCFQICLTV